VLDRLSPPAYLIYGIANVKTSKIARYKRGQGVGCPLQTTNFLTTCRSLKTIDPSRPEDPNLEIAVTSAVKPLVAILYMLPL
jgi:hypothetical protein